MDGREGEVCRVYLLVKPALRMSQLPVPCSLTGGLHAFAGANDFSIDTANITGRDSFVTINNHFPVLGEDGDRDGPFACFRSPALWCTDTLLTKYQLMTS